MSRLLWRRLNNKINFRIHIKSYHVVVNSESRVRISLRVHFTLLLLLNLSHSVSPCLMSLSYSFPWSFACLLSRNSKRPLTNSMKMIRCEVKIKKNSTKYIALEHLTHKTFSLRFIFFLSPASSNSLSHFFVLFSLTLLRCRCARGPIESTFLCLTVEPADNQLHALIYESRPQTNSPMAQ